MFVSAGEAPDNLETEPLPKRDRAFICADDEIELHRLEALTGRELQRMNAHGAGDAASDRAPVGDIAAIRGRSGLQGDAIQFRRQHK